MNWKFWKRKKISASDIGYLNDVNRRDEDNIEQLEKYHKLFCPTVKNLGEFHTTHNKILSDAIKEKIKSIRNHQLETTL